MTQEIGDWLRDWQRLPRRKRPRPMRCVGTPHPFPKRWLFLTDKTARIVTRREQSKNRRMMAILMKWRRESKAHACPWIESEVK